MATTDTMTVTEAKTFEIAIANLNKVLVPLKSAAGSVDMLANDFGWDINYRGFWVAVAKILDMHSSLIETRIRYKGGAK